MTDFRHGTLNGATNRGCKCDECRAAHAAYRREYRRRKKRDDGTQYVYFIRMGDDGPVKIGIAKDPQGRLRDLQVGCPFPLKLLATVSGGMEKEQRLHEELQEFRMEGEWFQPTPEVFAVVERELLAPSVTSWKPVSRLQGACSNCGVGGTVGDMCEACEEFAELRALGCDPFEEAA